MRNAARRRLVTRRQKVRTDAVAELDILDLARSSECLRGIFARGHSTCAILENGVRLCMAVKGEDHEPNRRQLEEIRRKDLSRYVISQIANGRSFQLILGDGRTAVLLPPDRPAAAISGNISESIVDKGGLDIPLRLAAVEQLVGRLEAAQRFEEFIAEAIGDAGRKFLVTTLRRGMAPRKSSRPRIAKTQIHLSGSAGS